MPLVRWQFRGLEAAQRKGWLFENLTDSRGRAFDGSVAVGIEGASPQVYAAAMGLDSADGILQKWQDAQAHPVEPVEVAPEKAPVKEVVIVGTDIVAGGGIDTFPVTVTNPGTDVSAYFSCPIWITHDPETGVYNVGTSRGHGQGGRPCWGDDADRPGQPGPLGQGAGVGPAARSGPVPLARAGAVAVQREQALPTRVRRRRCPQTAPRSRWCKPRPSTCSSLRLPKSPLRDDSGPTCWRWKDRSVSTGAMSVLRTTSSFSR